MRSTRASCSTAPPRCTGTRGYRLLRREVEDLARTLHGEPWMGEQRARTELARINRELKQLRAQLTALEERRAALLFEIGEHGSPQ
jgi:hypothetical protein